MAAAKRRKYQRGGAASVSENWRMKRAASWRWRESGGGSGPRRGGSKKARKRQRRISAQSAS